jgi:hypothetical protein
MMLYTPSKHSVSPLRSSSHASVWGVKAYLGVKDVRDYFDPFIPSFACREPHVLSHIPDTGVLHQPCA